jgi:predicted aspartyl protease
MMGEVSVDTRFRNIVDVGAAQRGYIGPEQIATSNRKCLVDTGAVMVLLPEDEADKLGLMRGEKVIVTYSDERKEELPTGLGLEVTIGGRTAVTDCVIDPPLCEPFIGQIVLEELDLLVDAAGKRLIPRPESPNRPLLKLK